MKIALIGADGQLGSDLLRILSRDEVVPLVHPEFDVTRPEQVTRVFRELGPETVINTAAFHRVDECEEDPETPFRVNAIAVRHLARLSSELGFVLVHFSTDYVFDGQKSTPYVESDPPNPLSVYAVSKLAGEFFVRALAERYFLIRTCGLFGLASSREKGYNFVDRMIAWADEGRRLPVVDDQWVSPFDRGNGRPDERPHPNGSIRLVSLFRGTVHVVSVRPGGLLTFGQGAVAGTGRFEDVRRQGQAAPLFGA
jgi:dTDP-4-dehydrorhamnose reductase